MGAILEWGRKAIGWAAAVKTVLGWFGLWTAVAGFLVLAGGVIWAALISIPAPLILMAGFCTFAAVCALTLIPGMYRVLSSARAATRPPEAQRLPLNQAVWRAMTEYSIDQISYLWQGVTPYGKHHAAEDAEAAAISALMRDGIAAGKLRATMSSRSALRGGDLMSGAAKITRESLISYAKQLGELPEFLKD
jgi:hypothetical protein